MKYLAGESGRGDLDFGWSGLVPKTALLVLPLWNPGVFREVHCLDTILILRRALSRGRWSPSILPWLVTEDLTLILLTPLPTHLLPVPTAPFLMWMSPSQPLREGPGLCFGPLGSDVALLLVWGQLPICYSSYTVVAFFFFF